MVDDDGKASVGCKEERQGHDPAEHHDMNSIALHDFVVGPSISVPPEYLDKNTHTVDENQYEIPQSENLMPKSFRFQQIPTGTTHSYFQTLQTEKRFPLSSEPRPP